MASSQSHVIPSEGLLRFRLYYFVRKFGKDVMFQIFSCCFLEGSTQTIREILDDNGVPLGTRRSIFTRPETDNLTNNPPETLDITCLNKICQILWEKGVNFPGDRIKDLMKAIKDERNAVSHEESNISQAELDVKLQDFGRTLEEALDEAEIIYTCHATEINQMKIDIGEATLKIQEKIREKYDPLDPEDIRKLKDEIELFRDQLRDYIQEKSVKHLKSLYTNLCQILPFDWLCQHGIIYPGSIMVSLKVDTQKEFHVINPNQTSITVDQSQILDKKDTRGNVPEVLIISGDAGSGKTTLLCWLIEKWYKEETDDIPGLESYAVLLYMEFRKHDHDKFDDYLQDCLQHIVADFGFVQVKSAILLSKCLILCDGYDERNSKSSKLFEEILNQNFSSVKIMVTTRPGNTGDLTYIVNRSRRLRLNLILLGLQEGEMKKLVSRLADHLVHDALERDTMIKEINQTYKTMTPEMWEILKNPLQFNLFVLLYIEYPDLRKCLTTVTNLFLKMSEHKLKRLQIKLGITGQWNVGLELEKFYKEWSLRYFLQRKYELSEDDVIVYKEKCIELGLDFDSVMSTYFSIKHSRRGLDILKIYCYRHRTEQEFAAVGAICDAIIELYEKNRSTFNRMQYRRENIINHVLKTIGDRIEGDESQTDENLAVEGSIYSMWHYFMCILQIFWYYVSSTFKICFSNEHEGTPSWVRRIMRIMKFITGILYNTQKDLLFLIIDDILTCWANDDYLNMVDPLLQHLLETNIDDQITDAVAKRIVETSHFRKTGLIGIWKSNSLACVPTLLSRIQPAMLKCSFAGTDPNDLPHLIPALETAVLKGIEISLSIGTQPTRDSVICDKYLSVAKTCVYFKGSLSRNGLTSLPTCLKNLYVPLHTEALEYLSRRLPDLEQLELLDLNLIDDGSVNPDDVSPIPYSGKEFSVTFSTDLDMAEITSAEHTSRLLNSFWPRNRNESQNSVLYLIRNTSSKDLKTGDVVKVLLENLEIRPLVGIFIAHTTDEAKDRKEEFESICRSRGLGRLVL